MIDRIFRGLGFTGDPMPSAGFRGSMSHGAGWTNLGSIPLVPALGRAREATYRMVYMTNPWVWAAVEIQARSIGRLPLHVYQLDANAEKTRVRGDIPLTPGRPLGGQALDRLLSMPMVGVSKNNMFGGTVRDKLIHGNALWEIERVKGQVVNLCRIPWRRVVRVEQVVPDEPACMYEIRRGESLNDTEWLAGTDAIHFGFWADPEHPVAPSILESCKYTLALHDAVVRHLVSYFGNAMRPSGHLSVDGLNREQIQLLREALTELYTSPENAGKILISAGKFESMSADIQNSQVAELIDKSREEIAAAFQIPQPVLGILDQAIKSNVVQLREQYVRDSLGPLASDFEAELQAQLLPQQPSWSSMFVEFQLGELLRPDLEARAIVYQRLMFVYSPDEIRSMENLPPFKIRGVTDVPWVASGAMPLPQAASPKAPSVKPTQALAEALRAAVVEGRVPAADAEPFLVAAGSLNGHG